LRRCILKSAKEYTHFILDSNLVADAKRKENHMSKTTGNYSTGVTRRNSWKGLIGMNFLMMRENNLVN